MSRYFQSKLNPVQDTYVSKFYELPLREYAAIAAEKQKRSDIISDQLGQAIDTAYGLQASKEFVADVEYTRQFKQNLDAVRSEMINIDDWTNPKVRTLYDSRIKKLTLDPRTLAVKSNYETMAAELKRQQELSDDFKTSDPRYLQFRGKIQRHNQLYPTQDNVGQFTGSYEAAYDTRKELQESMKNIKAEKTSDPKIGTKWRYIENGVELTEDQIVARSINSLSTRAIEEIAVNYEYSPEKQKGMSWEQYVDQEVRGQARLFVQKEKEITGLNANEYNLAKYSSQFNKPQDVTIPTVIGQYSATPEAKQRDFTEHYNQLQRQKTILENIISGQDNSASAQDIAAARQQVAAVNQEIGNLNIQREQWLQESKQSGLYDQRLTTAYNRYSKLADPNPGSLPFLLYPIDSPEDQAILLGAAERSNGKVMSKQEFEQKVYPSLLFSKEYGVLNAETTFPKETSVVVSNYNSDPNSSYQTLKRFYQDQIVSGNTSNFIAEDGKTLGEKIKAGTEVKTVDVVPDATGTYFMVSVNGQPQGMYRVKDPQGFDNARVSAANQAQAATQAVANYPNAANNQLAQNVQAISSQQGLYNEEWRTVYNTPGTVADISGVKVKTEKSGTSQNSRKLYLQTGPNKWEPARNANGSVIQFSNLQAMQEWLGKNANTTDYPATYLKNSKTGEIIK